MDSYQSLIHFLNVHCTKQAYDCYNQYSSNAINHFAKQDVPNYETEFECQCNLTNIIYFDKSTYTTQVVKYETVGFSQVPIINPMGSLNDLFCVYRYHVGSTKLSNKSK